MHLIISLPTIINVIISVPTAIASIYLAYLLVLDIKEFIGRKAMPTGNWRTLVYVLYVEMVAFCSFIILAGVIDLFRDQGTITDLLAIVSLVVFFVAGLFPDLAKYLPDQQSLQFFRRREKWPWTVISVIAISIFGYLTHNYY